jgi:hypothetical protein
LANQQRHRILACQRSDTQVDAGALNLLPMPKPE